ncbi:MAG TPA: TadE/TadG family type IV pilus assembly protein [Thermoguttaceae bacterium]|nr:TadE/TadG family type IV pilus assembly protein [Thermoguttaceae bacterium]
MKHPKLPFCNLFLVTGGLPVTEVAAETTFKVEKVCRSCRKHRRGAAAVEFAIVAPVFFLMILGMIEVGRAIMVQQVITNASREGARLAVLPARPEDNITAMVTQRVEDVLQSAGIDGATVQILDETGTTMNPQTAEYGDVINVTVSVPYSEVSWLPTSKYFAGKTLSASTVMRTERVQ